MHSLLLTLIQLLITDNRNFCSSSIKELYILRHEDAYIALERKIIPLFPNLVHLITYHTSNANAPFDSQKPIR